MALSSFQASFGTPHHIHDGSLHSGLPSPGSNSVQTTNLGNVQQITAHEAVEVAGRNVEKMIHNDSQFPSLAEKLRMGKKGIRKISNL